MLLWRKHAMMCIEELRMPRQVLGEITVLTGMGEHCKVSNRSQMSSSHCFMLLFSWLCFCTAAATCWKFQSKKSLMLCMFPVLKKYLATPEAIMAHNLRWFCELLHNPSHCKEFQLTHASTCTARVLVWGTTAGTDSKHFPSKSPLCSHSWTFSIIHQNHCPVPPTLPCPSFYSCKGKALSAERNGLHQRLQQQ